MISERTIHTLELNKIQAMLRGYAVSDLGKAAVDALSPAASLPEAERLLQETMEAESVFWRLGHTPIDVFPDIRPSLRRMSAVLALSMGELLGAERCLKVSRRAREAILGGKEQGGDGLLCLLANRLTAQPSIENEIARCILSEEEMADNASPELARIRRQMKITTEKVRDKLNSIIRSAGDQKYLQDSIITMRNGRYTIPVKAEHRRQIPGLIHDQSGTGQTLFIEPAAVVELGNEYKKLLLDEQKEIERILAGLTALLQPYADELYDSLLLLGRLDCIFAKAVLAREQGGIRPKLNEEGRLKLVNARHPLIDREKVVPVTLWLGEDFDTLIITGPNTGGKTVTLKTVGLFTLMAMCGLFLPAEEGSEVSIFDQVFADIGDEQSIEQSLSTFSAHMKNIVEILGKADMDSLCLFDELGAGTDPTEGAAIAISVLNFLHNMTVRTMATTHYSELKVYALQTPGVENACCEFNVETLAPTYRLLIGIPGKSNAFAISRKLGLPDYIIDDAKNRISEQDESFEDVIAKLEQSRVTIDREKQEIERYKAEIVSLKKDLEKREERFAEQREKILAKAHEEAARVLRDAKETADRTIRSINRVAQDSGVSRELEAERAKLREKMQDVDKKSDERKKAAPKKEVKAEQIRLGDSVRVISMNLTGTVSVLPDKKGDLTVQMGILQSKVKLSDIELLRDPSENTGGTANAGRKGKARGQSAGTGGRGHIGMSKSMTVSPEINLIGMTTDEAVPAMDKYLDDAYLAHLEEVRVIHGRGTGALRTAIHKELKRLKYVKEFRLGEYNEGGTGATVVVFKD